MSKHRTQQRGHGPVRHLGGAHGRIWRRCQSHPDHPWGLTRHFCSGSVIHKHATTYIIQLCVCVFAQVCAWVCMCVFRHTGMHKHRLA